ncbi:MAG: LysM peptidoglycan-binding domain-containing protein [Thermodesulfovibrionia bacterium]|nr:LysM peptidoglycan-binding domain-containing protein [Thermodesulfovibrionia bacterium]
MKILYSLFIFVFSLVISTQAWADKAYVIKKGDSLYSISKKFKIEIDSIKKANEIVSDKLMPGTKLIIPSAESNINIKESIHEDTVLTAGKNPSVANSSYKDPTEVKSPEDNSEYKTTQQPSDETKPRTYTVKKGDNLWSIAKKFSISVKELRKLNNIKSNKLKPAQKLLLEPRVLQADVKTPAIKASGSDFAEKIKTLSDSPEFQTTTLRERLVLFAQNMLGIPYKFGSNTFMGIDCSAFVQKAFSLVGIPLPRTAREQFDIGEPVDKGNLSVGDLVFFKTYASFPSHVGIYLGNNLFIHASRMTRKVAIDRLDAPYYLRRFIGAKRIELGEVEEKSL